MYMTLFARVFDVVLETPLHGGKQTYMLKMETSV